MTKGYVYLDDGFQTRLSRARRAGAAIPKAKPGPNPKGL